MALAIAAVFVVGGLWLAAAGVKELTRGRAFRRKGIQVMARVTEVRRVRVRVGGRRYYSYSPAVAFHTRDGRLVHATTSQAARPCPYQPGQDAPLWYDPEDSTVVEVARMGTTGIPWFLIPMGTLLATIGVVVGFFNLS